MRRFVAGFLFAGLFALFPAAPARSATIVIAYISINDFSFAPATVTVEPGWEVRWTNFGGATHTVSADAGAPGNDQFSSGSIPRGGTYQHPFSTIGDYVYHCTIHEGMTGTIRVRATAPAPPSPAPSPIPAATKSPTPKATPKKTSSPSPVATPTPARSLAPSPTPARIASPTPSPSPTLQAVAAPKPDSSGGAGVAVALLVVLAGAAILVYQRFVHGT